jgi:hypothetical protein
MSDPLPSMVGMWAFAGTSSGCLEANDLMADDSKPMALTPKNDDEWTIHALNIHGLFFERWCEQVVANTKPWRLTSTQYPVEFPPPTGVWGVKESTLDIRADLDTEDGRLSLIIECKKCNPGFVDWVFFPKQHGEHLRQFNYTFIDNVTRMSAAGWDTTHGLAGVNEGVPVMSEARETRGSYQNYQKGDKTKTSNTAITEAAQQVA